MLHFALAQEPQPGPPTMVRIENSSIFQIDRSRLKLHEVIGSGAFGEVYFASVKGIDPEKEMTNVAVKLLKGKNVGMMKPVALSVKR